MRDDYKRIEPVQGHTHMEDCPVCGGKPSLWQYSPEETAPSSKVVMCENSKKIGPQDGLIYTGCLLYMPNDGFYRPTAREAVMYWNEFAKALVKLRVRNQKLAKPT